MARARIRERFTRLVEQDDEYVDLLPAAFLVAQEEYPELRLEEELAGVHRIADHLSEHLAGAEDFFHGLHALNTVLFDRMGFRGNVENYDDPDNSMLNMVMRRRQGIPITLSILYAEIGRRVGFQLEGVSFPGHFLVRMLDEWGTTFVDPFHGGRILLRRDLEGMLRERFGPSATLREQHLEPASPRRILTRLLSNLKRLHMRRDDYERALRDSERILILNPDWVHERRDRGLLYQHTGRREDAINDLRGYLHDHPSAQDAPRIRQVLRDLLKERSAEG